MLQLLNQDYEYEYDNSSGCTKTCATPYNTSKYPISVQIFANWNIFILS